MIDMAKYGSILGGTAITIAASVAGAQVQPPPTQPPPPAPVYAPPPPPLVPPPGGSSATPKGNPALWVTDNDYPPSALRADAQGTTTFRLQIDPSGLVAHCSILESSGSQALDTATCDSISRRARFTPARDAQGRAITGSYTNRVRWALPADSGSDWGSVSQHPLPGLTVISFVIGVDGYASDCRVISGVDPTEFMTFEMPCENNAVFPIYSDKAGKPVARAVRMTIGVVLPVSSTETGKRRRK